jgi:hypothetical protein
MYASNLEGDVRYTAARQHKPIAGDKYGIDRVEPLAVIVTSSAITPISSLLVLKTVIKRVTITSLVSTSTYGSEKVICPRTFFASRNQSRWVLSQSSSGIYPPAKAEKPPA